MHATAILAFASCVLSGAWLVAADKWQPELPPEVCIRAYFAPVCISRKPHSYFHLVNLYECTTPGLNRWTFDLVDDTPGEDGALYNIVDVKNGHCLYPNPLGGEIRNGTMLSEARCGDLSYEQKTWFVQWCRGHQRGWEFIHKDSGLWISYSGLIKNKFYRPVLSTEKTYWRIKKNDVWVGVNTL